MLRSLVSSCSKNNKNNCRNDCAGLSTLINHGQHRVSALDGGTCTTICQNNSDLQQFSTVLACSHLKEAHTAQNILEKICEQDSVWNLKLFVIVPDNASNIVKEQEVSNYLHIPCFAHTLNLVVEQSLRVVSAWCKT